MKGKRIIALVLVLFVTVLSFSAALAAKETNGLNLSTSEVNEVGPDRIADGDAELSIFVQAQTNLIDDYENALMVRWYEEKTGVHVNFQVAPTESVSDQFNVSVASGKYPDIYNTYLTMGDIAEYGGPNGIFVALDDLIEEGWMPNFAAWLDAHPDLQMLRSEDGKLYAIPSVSSAPWMIYTKKMYVKTDWLEQYIDEGGCYPETSDDLEDMLRYFMDNDMNGDGDDEDEIPMIGLQPTGWGTDPTTTLLSYFLPVQGEGDAQFLYVNEDGETDWVGNTETYRDALRWLRDLANEGLYDKSTYTMSSGTYRSLISDNLVGVAAGATEDQFTDSANFDEWTPLVPLEGPTGFRGCPVYSLEYSTMCFSTAITVDCEDLEVAAKWLDYFFSDEGAIVASYGFEGFDYVWSDSPAIDGSVPSIVPCTGKEKMMNCWWGNKITGAPDSSLRTTATEGNNRHYVEAARAYEPYYYYFGIPLVGCGLTDEEEARLSECFYHVSLQSYYYSFDYITGVRNVDSDSSWEKFRAYINTDGMLDDYIRLVNKKFRGIDD